MVKDVSVVITLSKATPRASFGMPLIFAGKQTTAVAYKEVSSLEAVAEAGFADTTAVYKAAQLLFMQNNAPTTIAVCASTEDTVTALPGILNEGWRQLIVVGGTADSTVEAIATYIESCGKHAVYFASIDPDADTAVISACKGYARTVLVAYEDTGVANPEAAIVGATAGHDVGSLTYKNMILKGVTAQNYSADEVAELHEQGVITILKKAGDIVTSEGIVVGGEYIDIIDTKDYLIEQIEYQGQKLMNKVLKLPYDNRGISALEGVVLSVLKEAADNGMIAQTEEGGYDYTVEFGARADCAAADISARHYAEGKFTFTLAGAIHTAKISGTIIA